MANIAVIFLKTETACSGYKEAKSFRTAEPAALAGAAQLGAIVNSSCCGGQN
jgi:hypothetical protein